MIHIQTVKTDAFSMEYVRFGSGKKVFVILPGLSVHSVLKMKESVAGLFEPFTKDYTVYLFDRRLDVPDPYSIYDMARDTAEAMRKLGLEHVCLYGASQGGMIAMTIAIEDPDLVQRMVLAATAACGSPARNAVIEGWAALAGEGRPEDLYLTFGKAIYPPHVFESIRGYLLEAAKKTTPDELRRFIIFAQAIRGFDVVKDLKKISCPVLVVGSGDDQVLGKEGSVQIAEEIPGAELYLYDGYGHAVYDTAPDFIGRMLRFCQEA